MKSGWDIFIENIVVPLIVLVGFSFCIYHFDETATFKDYLLIYFLLGLIKGQSEKTDLLRDIKNILIRSIREQG